MAIPWQEEIYPPCHRGHDNGLGFMLTPMVRLFWLKTLFKSCLGRYTLLTSGGTAVVDCLVVTLAIALAHSEPDACSGVEFSPEMEGCLTGSAYPELSSLSR